MAMSPIRWMHGILIWEHIETIRGAQYSNPLVQYFRGEWIESMGLVLDNSTAFTCDRPGTVRDRWLGLEEGQLTRKPISFNCTTMQMFILGIYLRFVAMICLMAVTKIQSQGGGDLFEGRGSLLGKLMQ